MTLVPATGVVSTIAKAAQKDPEGASELVRIALFETLCDFIEADRDELDQEFSKAMTDRAGQARRALVRQYVSKRMSGEEVNELLEVAGHWNTVVKASSPWDRGRRSFDETKVHRDWHGRFARKLTGRTPEASRQQAVDTVKELVRRGAARPGSRVTVEGHQYDPGSGIPTGARHADLETSLPGTRQAFERYLNREGAELHPDFIRVTPHSGEIGGNRERLVDAAQMVAGSGGAARVANAPVNGTEFQDNLTNWMQGQGSSRAFRRIKTLGSALQSQTQPQSTAHTIGGVAALVGDLGPQAEQVLGNNIRRTAYRYRGTERRPDTQLLADVEDAGVVGQTRAASADPALRPPMSPNASVPHNLGAYYANPDNQRRRGEPVGIDGDTDALELRLHGDAAVAYYMRKLPNPRIADLTRQSGRKAPPSQGAIINANGRVVTQAQGFSDDHYLPFDLKNLRGLQGGQYVRTRVGGGPTEEDLYAGLLTGARQIQVVSNTGVFTVEFDPDVRGGRRYSDKARGMINRYAALVGRVAESGNEQAEGKELYAQDVDDDLKAKLKAKAYRDMGYDPKSSDTEYKRLLRQARMEESFRPPAELETAEKDKIREQVLAEYENDPAKTTKDVARETEDRFQQQRRDLQERRVRRLTLNGEGYHRALLALQQEFPYYIRNVDYQSLVEFGRDRGLGGRFGGSPNLPDPNYQPPGGEVMRRGQDTGEGTSNGQQRPQSGGAAGAGAPVGGGPPTGGAPGNALPLPRGLNFPAPAHKVDPLTQMAAKQPSLVREAQKSMSKLEDITGLAGVSQTAIPEKADEIDLEDWAGGNSFDYVRALQKKAGDLRRVPALVADQSQVTDEQAQQAVDAVRALKNVRNRVPSFVQINDADIDRAADELGRVVASRKPFSDPHDPYELYDPGANGLPQRFAAIDVLGDNAANYQQALDAVKEPHAAQPFREAVADLSDLSPAARREYISDRVAAYQALLNWGGRTDATEDLRPPELRGDFNPSLSEAKAAFANPKTNKYRQQLGHLQAAWSFVHARDLASTSGGGGGAPFAPPAQEAGQELPQAQPRRRPDPGLPGTVGFRVRKSDLLQLHPPGQDQGWRLVQHLLGVDSPQ